MKESPHSTSLAFSEAQIELIISDLAQLRLVADLELLPKYPSFNNIIYPLGRCREIRNRVFTLLEQALPSSRKPGLALMRESLARGATLKKVWGGLRNQYFQNAIVLNDWYIDVANDTVNPNKPRIEVLPLANSGFESIKSFETFIQIAQAYWKVRVYRNSVCPALAPFMPLAYLSQSGESWLGEANDAMLAIANDSQFLASESILATLPDLPAAYVEKWQATISRIAHNRFLHAQGNPTDYCQRYRRENFHQDMVVRNQAVTAFLTLPRRI